MAFFRRWFITHEYWVVWNMNFIFHHIYGIILPIDELIFFRRVETTNQNKCKSEVESPIFGGDQDSTKATSGRISAAFVTATGVGDCLVSALQLEGLGWGKNKGSNQTPNTYCRTCWIIINDIYLDKLCYDLTSRPHVRSDVGGAAESGIFDDLCMLLSLHLELIFCSSLPCWMAYPKMTYPPKNVAPLKSDLLHICQLGPRIGDASVHQETYRWNGSDSDCPPVSSNMASWDMFKLNEGVHRDIIYRWGSLAMFDCPRVSTFFHVAAVGGENLSRLLVNKTLWNWDCSMSKLKYWALHSEIAGVYVDLLGGFKVPTSAEWR